MDSFEQALKKFMDTQEEPREDLMKSVIKVVRGMIYAKKNKDNKSLVKYHTQLDKLLHEFTGSEGLTKAEK